MAAREAFDESSAKPVVVVPRRKRRWRPDTWESRSDSWLLRTNCPIDSRWKPGDAAGRLIGFVPADPTGLGVFLAYRADWTLIGVYGSRRLAIKAVFDEARANGLITARVLADDESESKDMVDELTSASERGEPAPEADNPEPVRHRFPRLSRERETELIDDAQHGNMGAAWRSSSRTSDCNGRSPGRNAQGPNATQCRCKTFSR
jgi:hypothetical protein